MRNLILATAVALALWAASGCTPAPQVTLRNTPPTIAWCAKLGPYLKPISATVAEYPDGTEVLTVRCYID